MPNRRWLVLLPVIFITYSLAYLDRGNYSFGAAAGMASDLKISSGAAALAAALFFLGYFLFQIPGALYAQHRSVRRLIFAGLIGWGALAGATGLVDRLWQLYAVRFLLGVVESAVLPALLILLARWFTRRERARVSSILILGNPVTLVWMSILSGYLADRVGWRLMFLVEGLPPILWAFVWWRLSADRPAEADWLAPPERARIADALAAEQRAIAPVKNFAAAAASPAVIALCVQYFAWSMGLYGFVIWLPSMLRGGPVGLAGLGWLSAAPYLAAVLLMLAVSAVSDRILKRKALIWPCLIVAAAAFYGSYAAAGNFWLSYGLLVAAGGAMYASYGPFFAYISEIFPANVSGGAMALVNSMGALGGFFGAYVVGLLNGWTGSPDASYLALCGALALAAAITIFLPEVPSHSIEA